MVALTINGSNLGSLSEICNGTKMLRMIALEIMALSFGWGIPNSITRIVKVVGYPAWGFNFIPNSIARIVVNPIF